MKTCLGFILLVVVVVATVGTIAYQWQSQASLKFERKVPESEKAS